MKTASFEYILPLDRMGVLQALSINTRSISRECTQLFRWMAEDGIMKSLFAHANIWCEANPKDIHDTKETKMAIPVAWIFARLEADRVVVKSIFMNSLIT
jgi:hypothetical protein